MGRFNAHNKLTLDSLLLSMPGVEAGKLFGYPGYKLNGRTFVFLCGDGIAVKLPEERAVMLTDLDHEITPFEPSAGTVWQSWVYIERGSGADYYRDRCLFEEAIHSISIDIMENKNAQLIAS